MANYTQRLVHTTGLETIHAALEGLPRELREQILAHAVDAGAQPLIKHTKYYARRSVRTGALYLSIGRKVKKYPNDSTAVAIVGPQRGYFKNRARLSKLDRASLRGAESPSHYAHLVEFGHHQVVGGSSRAKYNLAPVSLGRVSKRGNAITRMKRVSVSEEGKGKKVSFVQPRPFMRPGFMRSKAEVRAALLNGISTGIEKARAKLVKQGAHAA